MTNEEIEYDLLEVEKGNRNYGMYLKNHIQDIQNQKREMYKENARLKDIIKEVREYIEEHKYKPSPLGYELELSPKRLIELLEILDKENK